MTANPMLGVFLHWLGGLSSASFYLGYRGVKLWAWETYWLAGGEKQRGAPARALIRKPLLLLCDEPTGNLDQASADVVDSLLLELHQRQETILMVVTHSAELAARFPLRYELRNANIHPVGA